MSLNSLQDNMSRRAASMAAMAARTNDPQRIQAIQQQLVAGVQSGAIQPHVGIPLVQDLTQKIAEAKAQMAQAVAGAGMQQPQGQQGAPIAQQVMEQAAQAAQEGQQGQGVETLPSNLPQEYAGGGIIAFEQGGPVERYQNRGYTGDPSGMGGSEIMSAAGTANPYVGNNLLETLLFKGDEPEWKRKLLLEEALREREKALGIKPSVAPTATPAANINQDLGPVPGTTGKDVLGGAPNAAPAAPAAPGGGGIGFKMPGLQAFTPTPAVLPERTMQPLTDLNAITKDMPAKAKAEAEAKVKDEQAKLEAMDKPGFDAREARHGERKATQEKDSALTRSLNLMGLGFKIAGSKEKTLAGALGSRETGEGIQSLIQGEAASRAARDRLEDYRDNLEQQKVAAKKGNYQAAQTAGREASRDLLAATQFALTGAQAGNAQAISMYSVLQQGDIGKATVTNQGQQLQLSAVDSANRNTLGLAGLNLQSQQLAQTGAFQTKQLEAMDKRYAALDKQSQARMAQVRAGAIAKFNETQGGQLNMQLAKEYGPNWRTSTDPRSLQAQMLFKQAQNAYIMDALGQYDANRAAKDSSDL